MADQAFGKVFTALSEGDGCSFGRLAKFSL